MPAKKKPTPRTPVVFGKPPVAAPAPENPAPASEKPARAHPGRGGNKLSLAPLTPDQAMAALLRVKLSDVKKLEAEEAKGKKKG